jgi:hypothetical protein
METTIFFEARSVVTAGQQDVVKVSQLRVKTIRTVSYTVVLKNEFWFMDSEPADFACVVMGYAD